MPQYCSVKEIAKKFGVSNRRVQALCQQERIEGAILTDGVWRIPIDAKKPIDGRVKVINQKSTNEAFLSLNEVCKLFSISRATGRNWIKSGKLIPIKIEKEKYYFLPTNIQKMKSDFASGKDEKLKSRRNKKYISGTKTYQGYIEEKSSFLIATKLAELYQQMGQHPDQLRLILAEYALQLLCCAKGIQTNRQNQFLKAYCSGQIDIGNYQPLIEDLLQGIQKKEQLIEQNEMLFDFSLSYAKGQDSLGLIYLSLRAMNERKDTGAYYTPISVVRTIIDELVTEKLLNETKTICDPCCGTGNFLIYASQYQPNINAIYGQDLDELSVQIARINLCLACEVSNVEILYQNITCEDALKTLKTMSYDIIIGNPPWGYRYTEEYLKEIVLHYRTASVEGAESFSLFLEHGLQQCAKNGMIAFVLPESICMVKCHQQIRKILLQQTQICNIFYFGNIFSDVQCPAIAIILKKSNQPFTTKGIQVQNQAESFQIQTNRNITSECFPFFITDKEHEVLQTIELLQNVVYLKDNAEFALGIVTGDNKKYLLNSKCEGAEPILKGSEIFWYQAKPAQQYIVFDPSKFQQVANKQLYRAKEKLLYRFICDALVFAYDDFQTVSLNSCNIVIPQIENLDMKYIMAILNAGVTQFYFAKRFQSIKVLRSHIEQLPIPVISKQEQQYFVERVDALRKEVAHEKKVAMYQEINQAVMELFHLNHEQQRIINESTMQGEKYL